RDSMSGQCFGEQCVLVTVLKDMYGISHDSFSFSQPILGEKSSGASIINLRHRSRIIQAEKEMTSAVKMLVCVIILTHREEQITEIVLHTRESAFVSRLLIVKT